VSPRGVTAGRGREWELPKRNVSRQHSQNHSQELWEVIPLYFSIKNKKSFCNGSRTCAGWPMRLALIQGTPRARVDVIGIQGC